MAVIWLRLIMVLRALVTFFLVLASSCGYAAERAAAPLRAWDELVPGDLFADIADFDRTIRQEGNERVYVFSATGADGTVLMSVVVAVGPVGKRLDPAAWRAAFAQARAAEKARDFPQIGSRAQVQAPSFSPDGALSGVVFATSDELFDVLVSVFEASSAAPRGELTAIDAARRIAKAYDDTYE